MIADEQKAHCASRFNDVKKLLWFLCSKHERCAHYDKYELFSEAQIGFLRAYATFDETKGASFATWVYLKVTSELRDYCAKRNRRMSIMSSDNYILHAGTCVDDKQDGLDEVYDYESSSDAADLVE